MSSLVHEFLVLLEGMESKPYTKSLAGAQMMFIRRLTFVFVATRSCVQQLQWLQGAGAYTDGSSRVFLLAVLGSSFAPLICYHWEWRLSEQPAGFPTLHDHLLSIFSVKDVIYFDLNFNALFTCCVIP